eukprot:4093175-Amphidinium_carterae.1
MITSNNACSAGSQNLLEATRCHLYVTTIGPMLRGDTDGGSQLIILRAARLAKISRAVRIMVSTGTKDHDISHRVQHKNNSI